MKTRLGIQEVEVSIQASRIQCIFHIWIVRKKITGGSRGKFILGAFLVWVFLSRKRHDLAFLICKGPTIDSFPLTICLSEAWIHQQDKANSLGELIFFAISQFSMPTLQRSLQLEHSRNLFQTCLKSFLPFSSTLWISVVTSGRHENSLSASRQIFDHRGYPSTQS